MGIANTLKRFVTFPEFRGINLPYEQEARWLTESVRYSPDLGYLEQYEFQLLFSPEETRVGYERYNLIEESVLLCGGYTEKTFAFWMQEKIIGVRENGKVDVDRVGIPMRQDGEPVLRYMPPSLRIKGEVHAVRPWQFQRLDEYKRNTEQFRRQRVNILIPYRTLKSGNEDDIGRPIPRVLHDKPYVFEYPERIYILRCWMYVAIPEYWNNLLDAGFRGFKTVNNYESRKKRPWLMRYYDFPRQSYQE